MENIKNIIIDYGNVIFMIDFSRVELAFTQLGIKDVSAIFGHRSQTRLFDDFDNGLISSHEFRDGIRKLAENPTLTDEKIDHAWNALLIGVPEGMHEILLKLKQRYRTFLLSNNNSIHYEYCMRHIREKYGVDSNEGFFEKTYYSHLLGVRKPDEEIFQLLLADQKLKPYETLFIDDSPQHLETAKRLGIHTELCTKENTLSKIVEQWKLIRD